MQCFKVCYFRLLTFYFIEKEKLFVEWSLLTKWIKQENKYWFVFLFQCLFNRLFIFKILYYRELSGVFLDYFACHLHFAAKTSNVFVAYTCLPCLWVILYFSNIYMYSIILLIQITKTNVSKIITCDIWTWQKKKSKPRIIFTSHFKISKVKSLFWSFSLGLFWHEIFLFLIMALSQNQLSITLFCLCFLII